MPAIVDRANLLDEPGRIILLDFERDAMSARIDVPDFNDDPFVLMLRESTVYLPADL